METLTVNIGTIVTWTNLDGAPHTSSSGVSPATDGEWASGFLGEGDKFSFTFSQQGVFPYFCEIHTGMTGTVTVE